MSVQSALKARPTTYNGIEMRSRLEARVASWLADLGLNWEYEPRAFASQRGQYLPDFRIEGIRDWDGQARPVFLDVKGKLPGSAGDPSELNALADRMEVIYTAEPRAVLAIGAAEQLENGFCLGATHDDGRRLRRLVECPHRELLLAIAFVTQARTDDRTWVARCQSGCQGVAYRRTDTDAAHVIRMPEYGS